MFAIDSMALSVFIFTQFYSKAKERSSRPTGSKTEFNAKEQFKVTCFGISGKPTRDSVSLYNNVGLVSKI